MVATPWWVGPLESCSHVWAQEWSRVRGHAEQGENAYAQISAARDRWTGSREATGRTPDGTITGCEAMRSTRTTAGSGHGSAPLPGSRRRPVDSLSIN